MRKFCISCFVHTKERLSIEFLREHLYAPFSSKTLKMRKGLFRFQSFIYKGNLYMGLTLFGIPVFIFTCPLKTEKDYENLENFKEKLDAKLFKENGEVSVSKFTREFCKGLFKTLFL